MTRPQHVILHLDNPVLCLWWRPIPKEAGLDTYRHQRASTAADEGRVCIYIISHHKTDHLDFSL